MDEWNRLAQKIQAQRAQEQAAQAQKMYEAQAAQAQANISNAQSKPMGGLESVLAGIGEKFNDWGSTLGNIGRTAIGGLTESSRKAETKKITSDDSARRNEIARKYGYASYSDAANDDNASQDFWNEIRGVTEATQQRLANKMESDRNSLGNVRDIDLNTAKGQALSTASDVLQVLGPIGNVVGGVTEGVGSSYKNAAGGTDDDVWGGDNLNRTLGNAAIGGVTAFVGDRVAGRLASKAPGNSLISRAARSNIGRGTITGAVSGATGGGLHAGLNGGDVLGGALQGALGGALAGGTMAGTMGLIGSGFNRLNNRVNRNMPQAPVDDVTPTQRPITEQVAEQYINRPNNIETALQEAQAPTRRQIDVQYDGSGNGNVGINRQRNMYRLADRSGSTLDGILGPNNKLKLPNAEMPTNPYANMTDIEVLGAIAGAENGKPYADLADAIKSGEFLGDDAKGAMAILKDNLSKDTYDSIQNGVQERLDFDNMFSDSAYGVRRSDLPYLNRDEYYRDTIGRLGSKGNGNLRAEDVPKSMYSRLRNDAGKNSLGGNMSDNETILRELFGNAANGKDKYELYDMYQSVAEAPGPRAMDIDDIAAAVTNDAYNNNLGDRALNEIVAPYRQDAQPVSRQIGVQGAPSIADDIDVSSPNRGQLIQDIMPAQRRQAQPQVQAQATQEAPMPTQRIRRAADTSDIKVNPNLDPADVARLERQLTVNRQKQGAALLDQYGTLDKPVRRAVGAPEDVLATLYDNYGLKTPADVQYAANHVTGRDGVVSKMTRELAASADNVDTTITKDWLQELMEANGLEDSEQKVVTKQIAGALKRANTSSDGATTLDIMKQLEKQSARYKGKDGTYHNANESDLRKGLLLDLVHDELEDRLWEAAGDPKKVLTPKRITELKNMYKGNDTWADFIDNKLAKSRSGAELRSHMKPLVDGSKIVYGSKMSAGGFADNSTKRLLASGHPFQAVGQMAVEKFQGSDKAKQARADRYAKDAAKAQAQLTGQEPVKTTSGLKGIGQKALDKAGRAAAAFNDTTVSNSPIGIVASRAINRRIGQGEAQAVENRAALQDAVQQAQGVQSDYENAMLQAQQAYNRAQQAQNTMPDMLGRISSGMERALAAGDINAYSKLADLYKQALQLQQLQNPTSSSQPKALSASQSKALTGLQQLQTLAGMTPDLGTALANSPLGGVVDLLGGNDYANQAKSLALTLGYLQSGANITPREAENIGKSYIPTAYDSEQVRQQKLSRAEQLLRNYLADTGSLETAQ